VAAVLVVPVTLVLVLVLAVMDPLPYHGIVASLHQLRLQLT